MKVRIFLWLLIGLLLLSRVATFAQIPAIVWQKTYGDPLNGEFVYASARLGPDLYVHGGVHEAPSSSNEALLLFTRANGDSLYSRIFSSYPLNKIFGLAANPDGSFVATGSCLLGPGMNGVFLIKFNQFGTIIWHKSFPTISGSNQQKVIRVPDGYLIIGQASFDIIKVDLDGNQLWRNSFGGVDAGGRHLTALPDGSYLGTGWTLKGGLPTVSTFHKINYLLVKLRPNGDTIFTKVLGNPGNYETSNAAAPTPDGGVAVAGAYVPNVSQSKREGQVLKLDSLFNLQWELRVMPNGGNYENGCEFFAIQPTISGDYVVAGQNIRNLYNESYVARISPPTTSGGSASINWSQYITGGAYFRELLYENDGSAVIGGTGVNSALNAQAHAVKFTNLGQPFRPDFCATPPRAQFSYQVRPDSVIFSNAQASASGLRYGVISKWEYLFGDGSNLVTYSAAAAKRVAHHYSLPAPQLFGTAVKLVVTNNLFCTDTLTLYPFGGAPTGLTEATAARVEVKLYPNPLQQEATLELKNYQGTEKLQLQLTDLLGRTVQLPQHQIGATKWHLQKGSLSPGLYVYRIAAPNKLVAQGKLLVR